MSKFRVGQRVRVKYALTSRGQSAVGKVAVVTTVMDGVNITTRQDQLGYGLDIAPVYHDGDSWLVWAEDQLEPATDCYDKTEWSECIWRPEHLRVGA